MQDKNATWDKLQLRVIQAPVVDRIFVDAGPGTGKTAIACARVAYLINICGILPGNIWLISFTRTAVKEIRDRISNYLSNDDDAYEVKIATLDSYAWKIHSGFDEKAELLGSYEENIDKLRKLVAENDDVIEYLGTIEHLIVDEAQDIVGVRSKLVLEIIEKLSSSCGVTIFADEAQAIYGFTNDEESKICGQKQPSLLDGVYAKPELGFKKCGLQKVYRTGYSNLTKIFTKTRQKVMEPADDSLEKYELIKTEIRNLADDRKIPMIQKQSLNDKDNCLILYRRRAEVLLASSFLNDVKHRIRMSGMPHCIYPWVGACLSEFTKTGLTKIEFKNLWDKHVAGTTFAVTDTNLAWNQLVRIAGRTREIVDINRLRQQLGRNQPPIDICYPEIGEKGPILGTIHASKGREAKEVHLMVPGNLGKDIDYDEEARVVFVGATRAREMLGVGYGYRHYAQKLESSKRVFSMDRTDCRYTRVEIGRDNDITSVGVAGRQFFNTPSDVIASQKRILDIAGKDTLPLAWAYNDPKVGFRYRVMSEKSEKAIAFLSKDVSDDLFSIGKEIKANIGGKNRRPPDVFHYLRIFGIRTIVVPPESPDCQKLHEPWSMNGIMLAPIVLGYSRGFFPYY